MQNVWLHKDWISLIKIQISHSKTQPKISFNVDLRGRSKLFQNGSEIKKIHRLLMLQKPHGPKDQKGWAQHTENII